MKELNTKLILLLTFVIFLWNNAANGAAPVFGSATYSGSVSENVATDTTVNGITISASDADGDAITYSIISSAGPFKLKTDGTKVLTNGQSIDYETTNTYTLTIQALANGDTNTATVTITIVNVNETPSFAHASYSGNIDENSVNGMDIIKVTATDVDNGDTLTYSLTGTGSSSFSVLGTGVVEVSGSLDFETTPTYTLTLRATDAGSLYSTATIVISVNNINESPTFTIATYTATVPENNPTASVVTVTANDPDSGNTVSYSLSGSGSSHFTIHATSGVVSLSQALDFEARPSYSLTVAASDSRGGLVTTSLTVTVTNSNDAPVSISGSYTASIDENLSVGTNVVQTSATDQDSNAISYSLSGSPHFSITGTGLIKTAISLDYETSSSYSLTVTFSDGTASVSKAVSISVVNKNDVPTLPSSPYSASVAENSVAGTTVYDVNAVDADSNSMVYSLYGAGATHFGINSLTGVVTTSQMLNYEAATSYSLTVKVIDGNGGVATTSLTVTVTNANDSPQFLGTPYTTAVDENLNTGTSVLIASAIDEDSGNTLTYSLSGTNNGHFSISSSSGLITTAQALDYETVNSYSLTVSVSDGTATVTTPLTISVSNRNDEPAFSNAPYTAFVNENDAGAAVYTVSATDGDSDSFAYFISGSGSGDFILNPSTGVVTLARVLNFEATAYYFLGVLVLDGNGGSASTNLNVTVNNTNDSPGFLSTPYTANIAEGVATGTNVLKITAFDEDSGDTLLYSLSGTNASHFAVSSTGMITTATNLDKETVGSYSLTVAVSDGTASVSQAVGITVINANDAPSFTNAPYSASVVEGNVAASVYTASASDADGDGLTFSISGTGSTDFSINPSTGTITLTSALDYETETSYYLALRVHDGNGGVATTTINITVTDQNDFPAFVGTPFSATLNENQPVGTTVLKVIAADQDPSTTLTYSLSGTNNNHFTIGSSTGVITTAQILNRESVNSYSLTVSVSDGTASVNEGLTVTVNNANDAPVLSNVPYNASVNENTGSGSVYTVSATDADSDTVTYSLYGTGSELFSVHSTSGLVSVASALDYEAKSSYVLTVQASDSNGGVAMTSFYIEVVNQNDSPAFKGTPYSTGVAESVSIGTTVFRAQASDDDSADTLTYSLSGTNNVHFTIGSSTGIITSAQALNYESTNTYSLTVTVSDGTTSVATPLTISITDINDSPVFTSAPFNVSVNENEASAAVYTVSAMDQDSGDSITFVLFGSGSADFSLHSTTGVVTLTRALDYEIRSSYTLTVIASDTNGGSASTTLTVTVVNQNDDPTFVGTPFSAQIDENLSSGATVMKITSTDADSGNTLSYSLAGTNSGHFSISSSGLITTTQSLDYETANTYSLNVSVTDSTATVTEALTVTVRNLNDVPSFTSAPYAVTVGENDATAAVYTASAADSDGNSLTYYLSGVGCRDFSIHSSTGIVSLNGALDYESKSSYVLGITVRDENGGTVTTTLTVTVSNANDSPSFIGTPYSVAIDEDVGAGTTVFRASAVDGDSGDTLTYSLSGTNSSYFSIASSTGIITTAQSLDYETLTSYTLTITVTDGTASVTTSLPISVTDKNDLPVFIDAPYSVSVNENATTGTLLTLSASDQDSANTMTYSLLGPGSEFFSVHSTSGVVSLTSSLDREVTSSYVLTVRVSDGNGGVNSSSLSVSVNDLNDAPLFVGAPYTATVSEKLSSGADVLKIIADDQDGDSLTYSISGTNSGHFRISSSTGLIETAQELDFETINSYTLTASVTDGTSTVTTSVSISVSNINDAPTLTSSYYNVTINENHGAASVIDIDGSDADGDTLAYLLTGTGSKHFSMNSATGLITLATALDYESKDSYSLTIRVSDNKGGVVTASLYVTVVNQNDAPVFTGAPYTASIEENLNSGCTVYKVIVSDEDNADSLTYSLSGTNNGHFSISSAGFITTAQMLDYESASGYTLGVQVSDGTVSTNSTISVTVINVNDPPVFSNSTFSANMNENDAAAVVCAISATDTDTGPADTLTYSLFGAGSTQFSLHPSTGVVTLTSALDYEQASQYTLTVTVSDGRGGTVSTSLTVNVRNQNDAPVFKGTPYSTFVDEKLSVGSSVFNVMTTDEDSADTLTYFLSGTNSSDFQISSSTGIIQTAKVLDFEELSSYSLTITVTDGTTSVSQPITIAIKDINDAPVFTNAPYTASINENNVNASVYTASASDADNDTLRYLLSGSGSAYFSMHYSTGEVTLTEALNYEAKAIYTLTIIVSDGEGAINTTTLTVNVVNQNDAPQFTNTPYSVSIDENTATGTKVTQTSALDQDSSDTLTYSLSGSNNNHFSISNTGIISTTQGIDFESANSFSLSVSVSDGTVTTSTPITISVNNLNDIPIFTNTPYNVTINENTAVATSVLQISATDEDANGITFLFVGVTSSDFSIHTSSGVISSTVKMNYEKTAAYTLAVQADDGNGGKTLTTVTITVIDLNDESPIFGSASYTGHVMENVSSGTSVITVTATDLDAADSTLAYSLAGSNSTDFSVTSGGLIQTASTIDHESIQSYSLTLTATDNGGHAGTTTVIISVVNVIDNDPLFDSALYSANVAEDSSPATSIIRVTATDADVGDTIVYSLSGADSANFAVNGNTGVISTNARLDREAKDTYTFTITATDSGSRTSTAIITIVINDVNDNSPMCSQAVYTAYVLESVAADSSILTLSCPDLDIGVNGQISYSMASGDGGKFAINSSSGIISTSASLDYESMTKYTISVQASDGGSPPKATTTSVIIDIQGINDYAPSFIPNNTYELSLAEDMSIGHDVITVTASDADAGSQGQVTYSISSGDTYGNFAIDRTAGLIELRALLNYEVASKITLTVIATDGDSGSPQSAAATVIINVVDVNDNYPTCNPALLTPAVLESAVVGSTVAMLNCSDGDSGVNGQLAYTISTGNSAGNFNVSTSGMISMASYLDYESIQTYSLVITVSDGGSSSKSTQATIKISVSPVNEHSPVFTSSGSYSITVPEDINVGSELIRVTANDADLTAHAHGMVIYSIVSGNTGYYFYIARDTGALHLMRTLDRESVSSYSLVVQATDGLNLANATVTMIVSDVNDNDPQCSPTSYAATVREDVGLGTSVVRITCSDSDDGNNRLLDFSITSGNTNTAFTVHSNGTISTGRSLDYETTSSYKLTVKSRDSSSPISSQRYVIVEVSIAVTAVNEHAPAFTSAGYAHSIGEDISIGTSILRVTATDSDGGPQGEIAYSMIPLNAPFYIDTTTGIIRVETALDREATSLYDLTVTAHDKDPSTADRQSTNISVTVTVMDVNDNEPVFSPSHYKLNFAENTTVGTSITQMQCTDGDLGTNANLVYSITEGDPNSYFTISSSGEITIAKQLDYETVQYYVMTVQSRDSSTPGSSQLTAESHVDVIIEALNEYAPTFSQSDYNVTISENTAVGMTVIDIDATDSDRGMQGELTFSLSSGSPFYIDSLTGVITVKEGLDHEKVTSYALVVTATDGDTSSPKLTAVNVSVSVRDENDNEPTFTPTVYSVVIAENTTVGVAILSLTCADADSGTNGQFNMAIISGNTGTGFSISDSGVLSVASALDIETTTMYSLVIRATDQNPSSPLTGTAKVSVIMTDINEHTPQFTNGGSYNTIVFEDASIGSLVTNVTAIDNDVSHGAVIYAIVSGNSEDKFYIRKTDGALFVKKALDRETTASYTMSISATDQDPVSPKSSTATLIVTVSDVNDNIPICDPVIYSTSLVESIAIGTSVAQLFCSDRDVTPNIVTTYSISSGNSTLFGVSGSGLVTTRGSFDYEMVKSYILVLTVTDGGVGTQLSSQVDVSVQITGANEYKPVFGNSTYSVSRLESTAVGTTIATVAAFDQDHGDDGIISFSIIAGNTEDKFQIDSTSGVIELKRLLDRETTGAYTLTVAATDHGSPDMSSNASVVVTLIDVNDNSPSCSHTVYIIEMAENTTVNSTVVSLQCSDRDEGTNSQLTYNITAGNTNSDFAMESSTGVISLANSLNRESTIYYDLLIIIADGGSPRQSSRVSVSIVVTDINEFTPTFTNSGFYNITLSEATPIGTTILTTQAQDYDNDDPGRVTYSIASGNTADMFQLDSNSGNLELKRALDFEVSSCYILTIKASDNAPSPLTKSSQATVNITIIDLNDNQPVCSEYTKFISLLETAALGTIVFTANCSDPDSNINALLSYQISTGNSEHKFNITSGGYVMLISALNIEETSLYNLVVSVKDNGTPAKSTNISLNLEIRPVNEFVPTFAASSELYQLSILENITLGTIVFQAQVQDNDTGLHGKLRYTLVSGNDQNRFYLDPITGHLILVSPLDRETVDDYNVTIRVEDSTIGLPDVKFSIVTVYITVVDVNDNYPVCTPTLYSVDISEAIAIATNITSIICTDKDLGPNSQLTYTFGSGNTGNKFQLDNNAVIVASRLDHETTAEYSLAVHVTDNGVTSRVTVVMVTVYVRAKNEHTPVFQHSNYSVNVSEWAAIGTPVLTVNATDADKGLHGDLEYYVTSGLNGGVDFTIDKTTGVVGVGSRLDRETRDIYVLNITVRDKGFTEQERRSSVVGLTIGVTDENDNPPVFSQDIYTSTIPENVASGYSVARVTTTDADIGSNAMHNYSITGGDGVGKFSIVRSTGVVTALSGLDYETKASYYLSITARDGGSPQLSAVAGARIFLSDTNDNKPVFSPTIYLTSISETTSAGSDVMPVHATDIDTGVNAEIVYSVVDGDAKSQFEVNSTGMIRTKKFLDREDIAFYRLIIQASDKGSTPQTETVTVNVTILDVNDNAPVFEQSAYSVSVLEDAPVGFSFLNISATDADIHQNARLTYSIMSGNTGNRMAINSNTATVYSAGSFDRERTPNYYLTIKAVDAGTSPLSSVTTVHVRILDRNDNTPTFTDTGYSFVVTENQNAGLSIGFVSATDIDNGTHSQLVYAIEPGAHSNHFSMNPVKGTLFTAVSLDREAVPYYRLKVKVTDSAVYPSQLFNITTVSVTVLDLNDNAPSFVRSMYNVSVPENSPSGTSVTRVTATDLDRDANARLSYSLAHNGSSLIEYFRIDLVTGEVFVKSVFDFERINMIEVLVTAQDDGYPSLSGSVTLRVYVADMNDNTPVFNPTFYDAEIRSDRNLGPPAIVILIATDQDSGLNGDITYELDQEQTYFSLDSTTGTIILKATPGDGQTYTFRARAKDKGSPALTSGFVNIRIDTIDAEQTMVDIGLDITLEEFEANKELFLKKLSAIIGAKIKIAHIRVNGGMEKRKRRNMERKQGITITIYAISSPTTNSTDIQTKLTQVKKYLTRETIMNVLLDKNGNLKPEITNSTELSIFKINNVKETKPTIPPEPSFLETSQGIVTVAFCALAVVVAIVAILCWRSKSKRRELREQLREPRIRPRKGVMDSDFQIYKPKLDHTKIMKLPPSGTVIKIGQGGRRFDGKAVDPATGRVYAYNKVTGERVWLHDDGNGAQALYSRMQSRQGGPQHRLHGHQKPSHANTSLEPVFEGQRKQPGNHYDQLKLPGTPE